MRCRVAQRLRPEESTDSWLMIAVRRPGFGVAAGGHHGQEDGIVDGGEVVAGELVPGEGGRRAFQGGLEALEVVGEVGAG